MRGLPLGFLLVATAAFASDPQAPPPPVHSPEEAVALFEFAEPGYRIELVASEPMVQDPVAFTFDGAGRLWVVEMRGYMRDIDGAGSHDPIGRISVLEDVDGDGLMDRSTVFLDELVLPRAIAVLPDGVLVAENKPLWFVRDTDGDLVADDRALVDENYARDSIEHSANGLLRALDNWIYNAKEGHRYRRDGDTWLRDETEARGQWGICQDDRGRLFYNYNHSQLHADFVPADTLTRNANHGPSTGLSEGVTTTNAVFPIRPNLATNRGYIPGALDDRGRIQEFTSACAPFIYREALFPEFAGNAFVCETAGNLVKRNILDDGGLRVSGAPAYPDRDFLASRDERFRPVWIASGPDGALYLADMYRGIVQDAPHMSPYLRDHSIAREMEGPIHLGRIWRIVPDDHRQPEAPDFAAMSADQLVEVLAHPAGWWRDQAQTHLVEHQLVDARPPLVDMALHHADALARLHALWTLEGLGGNDFSALAPMLEDVEPFIQAAALRVLPSLGTPDAAVAEAIANLADASPSESLALQMVLTLGDLDIADERRFALLAQLLRPRINDPLMRDAALSSLPQREVGFLRVLWTGLTDDDVANPGIAFTLEALSQAATRSRDPQAIGYLLDLVATPEPDWKQQAVLTGVGIAGMELTGKRVTLAVAPAAAEFHEDLKRLFSWPGHTPEPLAESDVRPLNHKERQLFTRGRQIYLTSCVACHGGDGQGTRLLAPPLAGSDWVAGSDARLVRVLFHGLAGPITVSGKRYTTPEVQPVMPPLATLDNTDIAAVLTYIRREWGNEGDPILPSQVSQHRIAAQGRTVPWTEEELEPFATTGEDDER